MRRLFLLSLSMLLPLLLLTSCDEDGDDCCNTQTVDASLVWSGDYAVDGCGYILYVVETEHKPTNEQDIAGSYKTSSPTAVEVNFINYDKKVRTCMSGTEMNSIKVISLRTR